MHNHPYAYLELNVGPRIVYSLVVASTDVYVHVATAECARVSAHMRLDLIGHMGGVCRHAGCWADGLPKDGWRHEPCVSLHALTQSSAHRSSVSTTRLDA